MDERPRIERHDGRRVLGATDQRQRVLHRVMASETIEHTRHPKGNPGAHEHVVDTRQHGAVHRRQMRDLDLLEIVDPDRIGMPFPGEADLDEIGRDAQLHQLRWILDVVQRQRDVGSRRVLAAWNVVAAPDPVGHGSSRQLPEGPPHVAAGIAGLQTPDQNRVERRARHHAELPVRRHGAGKPPV